MCNWFCIVLLGALGAQAAVFDITSYGAVANDGADDTAAIQAALDAADAQSGVDEVYVPAGDYQTDMLSIGSDTILRGDGSRGGSISRLKMNEYLPNGRNILRNKSKQSGNVNITLEKICFDGNRSNQTNLYMHSVNMQNVVGLLVDDCAFEH